MSIAAAPISWGVCEVPGWGTQLAPDVVLAAMHDAGFTATELGPDGYLGNDAVQVRALLGQHQLQLCAGFVTAVLHDHVTINEQLAGVERQARMLADCGAQVLVLAVIDGLDYDERRALGHPEWALVQGGINACARIATQAGLVLAVHPHVGTVIEGPGDLQRVVDRTAAGICLDSGHMWLGGIDPVRWAREHSDRVAHVHLKDVDADLGQQVRAGTLAYSDAVGQGLYVEPGQGVVAARELLDVLAGVGYHDWIVLERDITLAAEPAPGSDADPAVSMQRSGRWVAQQLAAVREGV